MTSRPPNNAGAPPPTNVPKQRRGLNAGLTDDDKKLLIAICIQNAEHLFSRPKGAFWQIIKAKFAEARGGVVYSSCERAVKQLVEARAHYLQSMGDGEAPEATDLSRDVDVWTNYCEEDRVQRAAKRGTKGTTEMDARIAQTQQLRDEVAVTLSQRANYSVEREPTPTIDSIEQDGDDETSSEGEDSPRATGSTAANAARGGRGGARAGAGRPRTGGSRSRSRGNRNDVSRIQEMLTQFLETTLGGGMIDDIQGIVQDSLVKLIEPLHGDMLKLHEGVRRLEIKLNELSAKSSVSQASDISPQYRLEDLEARTQTLELSD